MTQEIFKRYEKKYMLTQKQYDALMPAGEDPVDTQTSMGNIPYPIFTLIHRISSWSDNPLKNRNIKKSCV